MPAVKDGFTFVKDTSGAVATFARRMNDLNADVQSLFESSEFQNAMAQWPSNPQAGLAQLRPIADSGDIAANAILASLYPQVGPWNEGIPYAQRAADAGVVPSLASYAGNMIGDPALHADLIRFVSAALDAGWPIDPLVWIPQLMQQGNRDTARALAELALRPPPAGARKQWDDLIAAVTPAVDTIRGRVDEVASAADDSVKNMRADEERVGEERNRAEQLVNEVADLANEGASRHLAKEYEVQAEKEEDAADKYQRWAVWLGALAALATAVIAYLAFSREHGAGAVLTKAALAIPFLAFAAYVARLAATHRKQAWRWRHIELQLRTANPFVSPLQDEQRRLLIAALALRFFPGQRFESEGGTGGETVDPVAFLAQLLPGAQPPPATAAAGEAGPPGESQS